MRPDDSRILRLVSLGVLLVMIIVFTSSAPIWARSLPEASIPLTLEAALREAHRANARLPVAALGLRSAQARAEAARGRLYPELSMGGDLHSGTPQRYASGDAMLAIFLRAPLYEGGALRAKRNYSDAKVDVMRAGYRRELRDVDYQVEVSYGRLLHAKASLSFRRRAVSRLRAYLSVVEARQASGQNVGADVLLARQRLASAQADTAAATNDLEESRLLLNDVLGREPDAPLTLAPLPDPSTPPESEEDLWMTAPDIGQAAAEVRAAQSDLRVVRSERKPQIVLEANAGAQPRLGTADAPLNIGQGWGTELTLWFSLPLWNHGVVRGQVNEATAALAQARQRETAVRRSTRLSWYRALSNLRNLYAEVLSRGNAVEIGRDAYLQAESLYRGGQGRALEVLDAYDSWIRSGQDRLDVIYAYRVAQAGLERWGRP